jgi:hypothetical protein
MPGFARKTATAEMLIGV